MLNAPWTKLFALEMADVKSLLEATLPVARTDDSTTPKAVSAQHMKCATSNIKALATAACALRVWI